MNMKTSNVSLNYKIRELAKDKDNVSIITDLYKNRDSKSDTSIYLPIANRRFDEICEDPSHEGYEKLNDICFTLNDTSFLRTLEDLKVLKISMLTVDDDGEGGGMGYIAVVQIRNSDYIEHLHEWVMDSNLILNYGIFSLHIFTGEAYCLDNKYKFHTGKGLFRVLRAFLEEKTHILGFQTIYKTFHADEKEINMDLMLPESIHQVIGDIKENLMMKGKLSKFFITSSSQYILKSGSMY